MADSDRKHAEVTDTNEITERLTPDVRCLTVEGTY